MTKNHPYKTTKYFRFDGFSFGGPLEYILQHALAKFQPATTCNSQNTSQNTQKHQKHAILLSKPVALYIAITSLAILQFLGLHMFLSRDVICSDQCFYGLYKTIICWENVQCPTVTASPEHFIIKHKSKAHVILQKLHIAYMWAQDLSQRRQIAGLITEGWICGHTSGSARVQPTSGSVWMPAPLPSSAGDGVCTENSCPCCHDCSGSDGGKMRCAHDIAVWPKSPKSPSWAGGGEQ